MSASVILCIFSGRPNPQWRLSEDQEAQLVDLTSVATPSPELGGSAGGLGYSGFAVHPEGQSQLQYPLLVCDRVIESVGGRSAVDSDRHVEQWLLGTAPTLDPLVKREVSLAMSKPIYRNVRCKRSVPGGTPSPFPPTWNPVTWNQGANLIHDNCYNYANDLLYDRPASGPTAVPGQRHGAACAQGPACRCPDYTTGVIADGLTPSADFVRTPGMDGLWFVALFVNSVAGSAYEGDFHLYRQDGNGYWSHKPGALKARNCDEQGQLITDPRRADTDDYDFCGFFKSGPGVEIG
jgi:hypothetical protein